MKTNEFIRRMHQAVVNEIEENDVILNNRSEANFK